MQFCQWRVTTSLGRVIETPADKKLNRPPERKPADNFCASNGFTHLLEYPGWCMYNGETIVSAVPFNCDAEKHDCLNGNCVKSTDYDTPGKYANLADCQAGCAKDAACNGECVPREKIAELDQAINAAQARLRCK